MWARVVCAISRHPMRIPLCPFPSDWLEGRHSPYRDLQSLTMMMVTLSYLNPQMTVWSRDAHQRVNHPLVFTEQEVNLCNVWAFALICYSSWRTLTNTEAQESKVTWKEGNTETQNCLVLGSTSCLGVTPWGAASPEVALASQSFSTQGLPGRGTRLPILQHMFGEITDQTRI